MNADTTGRQIAESMMDRAEARYRHEHGQPHRRDRCEDCAREAVAAASRPGHLRDAAGSLRTIAEASTAHPEEWRAGVLFAAEILAHAADDLSDDLSTTDTEGAR